MADPQEKSEIERIIVAAIEKHARGDVEALARGIIEELRAAGLTIRRVDEIPIRQSGGAERGTSRLAIMALSLSKELSRGIQSSRAGNAATSYQKAAHDRPLRPVWLGGAVLSKRTIHRSLFGFPHRSCSAGGRWLADAHGHPG